MEKHIMQSPIGKGLTDLNSYLRKNNLGPIELNVIGGFALMLHNLRNPNQYTDVDYIGAPFNSELNEIIDNIGLKHKLGRKWINNDVMLSGISIQDFEFATGKLHFQKADGLSNIKINVLDQKDLLRMKIIALDTSLMAVESGGDFTRAKDMYDIAKLMQNQKVSIKNLKETFSDYINSPHTVDIIKTFRKDGIEKTLEKIDKIPEAFRVQADARYQTSAYLDNYVQSLFASNAGQKQPSL